MILFLSCFKIPTKNISSELQSQEAIKEETITYPTFFHPERRKVIESQDSLWNIEGYYGYRGFTLQTYDVSGDVDSDFLHQKKGEYHCEPPSCTVLYTEPNYPPEMAFWQSLISHFTYFTPLGATIVRQNGWGTIAHINTSDLQVCVYGCVQ